MSHITSVNPPEPPRYSPPTDKKARKVASPGKRTPLPAARDVEAGRLPQERVRVLERENTLLFWGHDSQDGPIAQEFREALSQNMSKIVVSCDIARTALSPYSPTLVNSIIDSYRETMQNLNVPETEIANQLAGLRRSLEKDPKLIFEEYDIFLHHSGSYLIFRAKGDTVPEERGNDSFSQIHSFAEIPSKKAEPFDQRALLEAFSKPHRDGMTLYICGHGVDYGKNMVAGIPSEDFNQFLKALEAHQTPDCVVLNTCFGGGKKHIKVFPSHTLGGTRSKTTYVVNGLGSTVSVKASHYNFASFFEKMNRTFQGDHMVRPDELTSPLSEIGFGDFPTNRPMLRFPEMETFRPIQGAAKVETLTPLLLHRHQVSSNKDKPIVIPPGTMAIDQEVAYFTNPIEIHNEGRMPVLFFNREHSTFAIDEIRYTKGDCLGFIQGVSAPLLILRQSEPVTIYVGKVTFEDGSSIQNVKMSYPGFGEMMGLEGAAPALIGFYDDQGVFYICDIFFSRPFQVSHPDWETAPSTWQQPCLMANAATKRAGAPPLSFQPITWQAMQQMLGSVKGYPYQWHDEVQKL